MLQSASGFLFLRVGKHEKAPAIGLARALLLLAPDYIRAIIASPNAEQLTSLPRQHCDIGQGYLFDQPIDGRHLLTRLQQYTGTLGND